MTDANSAFGLTLDYLCPASNPQVYLTATGGHPGLAFGTSNKALAMMTALGACSTLGSSTYISVNELTTVGALAALYPYATGYANIGSGTSDSAQMTAAFAATSEYVNPTTGTVRGPNLTNTGAHSYIVTVLTRTLDGDRRAGDGSGTAYNGVSNGTGRG